MGLKNELGRTMNPLIELGFTEVGSDMLPELPRGWPVAVDTEGSGLFVDGDPIPAAGRAAQPPARISVVSVSFRWPEWSKDEGKWVEGEIVDYAWPFDQGPVLGKPGMPVKDPETGVCTFAVIDEAEQARILRAMSRVLGQEFTPDDIFNLPVEDYVRLVEWIDRRDLLIEQNSKHDMHQFRAGLRENAAGQSKVTEGYAKWDHDTEPGEWTLEKSLANQGLEWASPGGLEFTGHQRLGMMEPSKLRLKKSKVRRRVHDTMLVQKQFMDPLEVASLKPTSVRLFGEGSDEDEVRLKAELSKLGTGMTKRYDLLLFVDGGAMKDYAAADTNRTLRIYEYERYRVEMGQVLERYQELERKEFALRTTLFRMERRGVHYAKAESWAEGQRVREWNKEVLKDFPFDVTKPNAAKRFYFGPVCSRAPFALALSKRKVEVCAEVLDDARGDLTLAKVECVPNSKGRILQRLTKAVESAQRRVDKAAEQLDKALTVVRQLEQVMALGGTGLCPSECEECGGRNGLGVEPLSRTETGLPQLDELAIQYLAHGGHPFALDYKAWHKRRKASSDWYTNWAARVGPDGRIRTDYRQTVQAAERAGQLEGGVRSSRLSCNRWGALQIPKKDLIPEGCLPVRGFIDTEPGFELYEHDLATGEFRVAVVLAGITRLWDALDNGLDVHAMNAKALFGVTEDDPKFKTYRQAGKGATFCILYGGGAKALKDQLEKALGIEISIGRADSIIKNFYREYPEFKRTTAQALGRVDRDRGGPGFLTMLDGWQRWYALNEKTNSAFNQAIQANLARCAIQWMIEVEKELPGVMLLQIHDSLITRHTADEKGRLEAQKVSEIGNRVFEGYFRLPQRGNRIMDFGIEPDRWSAYK